MKKIEYAIRYSELPVWVDNLTCLFMVYLMKLPLAHTAGHSVKRRDINGYI
jgi:hypothetical protein